MKHSVRLGTGEIHPLLLDRHSSKSFDISHTLTDPQLVSLLEAARWAPSAGNSQPWAFLVGRRGDAAHRAFLPFLAPSVRRWAPAASALMFSLQRSGVDPQDPSLTYSDYAAYDLGQSVAHLSVQAGALGLTTHQFAAFNQQGLTAAAAVPANWHITTGIAIGVAGPDRRSRERRSLDDLAFGGMFGHALDITQ